MYKMRALFCSISRKALCINYTISHTCYNHNFAALNNVNHHGIFFLLRIYYYKNINAGRPIHSICIRDAVQAYK